MNNHQYFDSEQAKRCAVNTSLFEMYVFISEMHNFVNLDLVLTT